MSIASGADKSIVQPARLALVVGRGTMRHIGRVVQHLTVGLLDEPMRVTVIAPQGEDISDLPSPPVDILTYPTPRLGMFRRRTVENLADQLAEYDIELLHGLDAWAHDVTRDLSDLMDLPYMVSVIGINHGRLLTPLGGHCRAVLAASIPIRADLLARHVALADKTHLLRPGVHQLRRVSCFADPQRSAAIIAGGNLDIYEPFAAVLEAFAAIRDSGTDCVFFMMGNGKAERQLRLRAEQLNLMHQLTFVDHLPQNQLAGIFKAADIFVYPHSSGTLEMELLEAMAAGIPVMVGGPCVGDFIIDTETALTYNGRDAVGLTAKLKMLLENHGMAVRLAETAMAYLRQHHSPAQMVAAMAETYRQQVLSGRTLKIS